MTFYLQFISGRVKWLTHGHTASTGRFITEWWILKNRRSDLSQFWVLYRHLGIHFG